MAVQLDFNRLGTSEWIKLGSRLKSSRTLLLHVFSLYGFIVVYSFLGLELLFIGVVCEKSAIESTGYCTIQVRNEDLSLHRAIVIMPTSGESDEITEQEKIIGIKREKRNRKTVVTKTRHNLERLSASGKDSESIQNEIDTLWGVLEACLAVMDELQSMYLRLGDKDNMKSITEEAERFGKEINDVIEKAEGVVKDILEKKHADATEERLLQIPLPKSPFQPAHSPTISHSSSSPHSGNCNRQLNPLKVPVFSGEKSNFEDFWEMFLSLVDQGGEPANIKMARLRQSLTGTALEAIRGLGVTEPEYNEAKEILHFKFGGERRKLQAYMDQIQKMPPLKSNDVQAFEQFADLVRIAVVKVPMTLRQCLCFSKVGIKYKQKQAAKRGFKLFPIFKMGVKSRFAK